MMTSTVKERIMVMFLIRPQHFPLPSSDVGRSGCYRHVYKMKSLLIAVAVWMRIKSSAALGCVVGLEVSDVSKLPVNTVSHPS